MFGLKLFTQTKTKKFASDIMLFKGIIKRKTKQ